MANTAKWAGASGVIYEFEIYNIGQEFNPVSGVYIFCKLTPFGRLEALYVGEAQSFNDRLNSNLRNHDGFKSALAKGASIVAVTRVEGQAKRLGVETDLRHGLDPICNKQPVPSLVNALRGY